MPVTPPVYLAGKKAIATIDGVPMAVETGSYSTSVGVDEMTNLNSEGFYEDIGTVRRATCSLTCIYNGADPPTFNEDDVIALSITIPGKAAVTGPPSVPAKPGGPALSGNFRIMNMTYPIVNPKVGVKYSFDLNSQGAFTKGQSPEV